MLFIVYMKGVVSIAMLYTGHVLCPGSTCNATVVSRRYRIFTTVVETLTTVALLVEPDFYDGGVAQL